MPAPRLARQEGGSSTGVDRTASNACDTPRWEATAVKILLIEDDPVAVEYLVKPVSEKELVAKINTVMAA